LTILTAKSLLIKISKILKYSPGIYKQFLFSSTNSILCSIRHSSGLQGYFTNTNSSALSR